MSDNSLQFQNLLFPHEPFNPRVVVLMGAWIVIVPALVDGILLLRIHAVYPYARTPHLKFFFVMGVPVLTIIARFINAAIFLSRLKRPSTPARMHMRGKLSRYSLFTYPRSKSSGHCNYSTICTPDALAITQTSESEPSSFSSAIFLRRVYTQATFSRDGQ
jgi:hypothetical protein